jgi:putative ubiquitin-RnfH superfamily antitoxin RatB of RatAB toxin-antitoxin module
MQVEVVLALARRQEICVVELPDGAAAYEAVSASGMPARHGWDAAKLVLGIAGRRVAPDRRLRDGDRVEILRPLAADPNEARRARARRGRRISGGS